MVLYQLLLALMFHVAFFMDGSSFTAHQVRPSHLHALSLAFAAGFLVIMQISNLYWREEYHIFVGTDRV